jgi:hypothetical protein
VVCRTFFPEFCWFFSFEEPEVFWGQMLSKKENIKELHNTGKILLTLDELGIYDGCGQRYEPSASFVLVAVNSICSKSSKAFNKGPEVGEVLELFEGTRSTIGVGTLDVK